MRIASFEIFPAARSLRRPLHTASGAALHLSGVALQIRSACGEAGQGEAPLPPLSPAQAHVQRGQIEAALAAARRAWLGAEIAAARDWLQQAALHPAAVWALATALGDLESRLLGVSLAAHLSARFAGAAALESVAANELISAVHPGEMEAAAAEAAAQGARSIKMKVGMGALAEDVARVAAARSGGPRLSLRLDANGAWDEAEARRRISALRRFDIEFIEQPVAAREIAALARLRRRAEIPIAADEAARDEAGALAVLAAEAADMLVLKPAALGDFFTTRRCTAAAGERGVGVVLGSLLDGPVSLWASLHLAAALGISRACGIATGALLLSGAASAPVSRNGALPVPKSPGLGEVARGAFALFAARGAAAHDAAARGADARSAKARGESGVG